MTWDEVIAFWQHVADRIGVESGAAATVSAIALLQEGVRQRREARMDWIAIARWADDGGAA